MLKILNFYGRFLIPFSRVGYRLHGGSRDFHYSRLKGSHWLITGATGGIGAALVRIGAANGADVVAVGRNEDKLSTLAESCRGASGSLVPMQADLGSVGQTRALADTLSKAGRPIDVLVNNVGVLNHDYRETSEGVEEMYAVNLLNPFILTETLLESGAMAGEGVIINMASGGLYNAPLNLPMLEQGRDAFNGFAAYASHKRAQIALSDRWTGGDAAPGVRAYTMHPGWADTDGVKRSLPRFRKILHPVLRTSEQGADTALWLASERPDAAPGALWFDRQPRSAHVYEHTRTPMTTPEELFAKLQSDAARRPQSQKENAP